MISFISKGRKEIVVCSFCTSQCILVSRNVLKSAGANDEIFRQAVAIGDRRSFTCCVCEARNQRDENGRPVDRDPAWQLESLNADSFNLRAASTSSSQLANNHTLPGRKETPFCQECLTNQTLQLHLIADFIPGGEHIDEAQYLERLPKYKESLEERYPSICANCSREVDRLISESDARVMAQVLQSKLKQARDAEKLKTSTKGKGRLGGLKGSGRVAEVAWACRGCLWGLTHLSAAGLSIIGLYDTTVEVSLRWKTAMMATSILSLLWCSWDPLWHKRRGKRKSGSNIKDRWEWIVIQVWLLAVRCLQSASLLAQPETGLVSLVTLASLASGLLLGFTFLDTERKPPLRLIRPRNVQTSGTLDTTQKGSDHDIKRRSRPTKFRAGEPGPGEATRAPSGASHLPKGWDSDEADDSMDWTPLVEDSDEDVQMADIATRRPTSVWDGYAPPAVPAETAPRRSGIEHLFAEAFTLTDLREPPRDLGRLGTVRKMRSAIWGVWRSPTWLIAESFLVLVALLSQLAGWASARFARHTFVLSLMLRSASTLLMLRGPKQSPTRMALRLAALLILLIPRVGLQGREIMERGWGWGWGDVVQDLVMDGGVVLTCVVIGHLAPETE